MATTTEARRSPRDKLLDAAEELFYEEGIHSVGIDRVIEHAGVAKASLYNSFGSKDELIRSYLQIRHDERRQQLETALAAVETPVEKMLCVFDVLSEKVHKPGYRGCAFFNASTQTRAGSPAEAVTNETRTWLRGVFVDLAETAGARDPHALACQLNLLYDGAVVGSRLDHNPDVVGAARATAETLIAAALRT